jgi:N-methylhydantoinase B
MLNCTAPAAVNSRTQTCQRVVDLIHGALAAAIPDRIIAACNGACVSSTFSGVDPRTGRFYVYLETIGGGSGARATKDGLDGVHVHITNTSNLPVEALEAEYPLVVERYALVEDSGGPGTWRGGLGLWRQIRAEGHECHAFVHGSRRLSAPWGLFGGREGGRCRIVYSPGVPPPVRGQGFLGPGSVGRNHHTRRGRLRRSARARSRAGPARSGRGHHLGGCRARRVRPDGAGVSTVEGGAARS